MTEAGSARPRQPVASRQTPFLIELSRASVEARGARVLREVSWSLRRGEHWAILGGNGAGKSSFLRLLLGEVWPAAEDGGARRYAFGGAPTASAIAARKHIALVSGEQHLRYARNESWQLDARTVVLSGLYGNSLLLGRPSPAQRRKADALIEALGIADLATEDFRSLSQGQLRKTLIARALIGEPAVLLLDEVTVGLDSASRRGVLDLLDRAAERGAQLVCATHRGEDMPRCVNRTLTLREGRVVDAGVGRVPRRAVRAAHEARFAPIGATRRRADGPYRLRLTGVTVARGEPGQLRHTIALRDVNWRVNPGEHWMVLGPNGSGKSTLIKLILGELWPAVGGAIHRFGDERPANVWEVKRRIGWVSHELQARYAADWTARRVIASGFTSSIGWTDAVTPDQARIVEDVIDRCGLRPLAERSLQRMSFGQARRALIARALVTSPELLALDEPFDGLDAHARAEMGALLEELAAGGAGLILISHHDADTLPCITHRLWLKAGRIVRQEERIAR